MQQAALSYAQVNYLLHKYNIQLQWDAKNYNHYAIFEHNWLNEYLFLEDAASFQAKLELVKKYHLRGISVFTLGDEDPKIWNEL